MINEEDILKKGSCLLLLRGSNSATPEVLFFYTKIFLNFFSKTVDNV